MVEPHLLCLLMFLATIAVLMAGVPVAFALAGTAAVFAFIGAALGSFDITYLAAFPQRIFGTMSNDILVAVPLFIFMGVMLERSRVAEDLLGNMGRLFGRHPGGLAYAVCLVGALLAASTGIVGATVVTMGLISLPSMLKAGYSRPLACGTIAASGTLGQIIPPSIILVLLGDQLSVAYQRAQFDLGIFAPETVTVNDLFAGALVPGLVLVGLYVLFIGIIVTLRPALAPPIRNESDAPPVSIGSLAGAMAGPLFLIVAVLGSILGGLASPTEAASVGAIGAVMLAARRTKPQAERAVRIAALAMLGLLLLTANFDLRIQRTEIALIDAIAIAAALMLAAALAYGVGAALVALYVSRAASGERVLVGVMRSTTLISTMVFMILLGAAMFSLVFRGFRGDEWVEGLLTQIPGGAWGAIFAVMLVMFIMGFFLDFLEIVFIVVPIVAPVLLKMEIAPGELINPVWLGVMMAVNLQTSFLTPPFGFSLFYLRGVAPPEVKTLDLYKGVVPFILLQLLCLILLWFAPGLATWLPAQLYGV
jgi:tripartite ATP-independent transporter DctM subunit